MHGQIVQHVQVVEETGTSDSIRRPKFAKKQKKLIIDM